MNASPHSKHIIAKLCMALHEREPLECRNMTQWEAHRTIQWLSLRLEKKRKGGSHETSGANRKPN